MELEGFDNLSDQKGNIKIASKFALGKIMEYNQISSLTGLGYRITGMNGMNVTHVIGLYANLGHGDFCKMMLMVRGILVGDDMNEFLQRMKVLLCSHEGCGKQSKTMESAFSMV